MATMDMELKKAFTEMQINTTESYKKMKMIDLQCDVLKTSKQKYILTQKSTGDLDLDTRVYSSIGRMFVLTSVEQMRDDLKVKQDICETLITQLSEKKHFLVKNLKIQEDSLRELVQQKKDATELK